MAETLRRRAVRFEVSNLPLDASQRIMFQPKELRSVFWNENGHAYSVVSLVVARSRVFAVTNRPDTNTFDITHLPTERRVCLVATLSRGLEALAEFVEREDECDVDLETWLRPENASLRACGKAIALRYDREAIEKMLEADT